MSMNVPMFSIVHQVCGEVRHLYGVRDAGAAIEAVQVCAVYGGWWDVIYNKDGTRIAEVCVTH